MKVANPQQAESRAKIRKLVMLSILSAIIILLQLFGSYIKIGTIPFSLVLIPIVLGAMLYGPVAGAILGFVFSAVVFVQTIAGVDVFSLTLFTSSPPLSYILLPLLIFLKGTAAGFVAGLVFKLISKKNELLGTIVAAIVTPFVNTGIFLLFASTYFWKVINETFNADGHSMVYFLFIIIVGVNFLIELGLNAILAPVLCRLLNISKKRIR